jgi:hypothetical protein
MMGKNDMLRKSTRANIRS